mgnify:CR=1 FL=1
MITLREPVPILPGTQNAEFLYNDQLRELYWALLNLSLTQRDGAIQNNDKVGNLDAVYIVFTSNGTANTEDTIAHKLGRTPISYIPTRQDKSATLYDGTTTFTSTNIYLKSSAATVAWTVIVF